MPKRTPKDSSRFSLLLFTDPSIRRTYDDGAFRFVLIFQSFSRLYILELVIQSGAIPTMSRLREDAHFPFDSHSRPRARVKHAKPQPFRPNLSSFLKLICIILLFRSPRVA